MRWVSLARRCRGALPAGSGGRVEAIRSLASARNGQTRTCRPGRLAAVSASAWLCRPSLRLACAPLFCALVIHCALFQTFCGPALPFHPPAQARRASGGRCRTRLALMPPQPFSVATKATSARCRKNAIASVERQATGPSTRAPAFNLDIPYGVAIGAICSICHCTFARF